MSKIKKIISAALAIMAAAFIVVAFSACVSTDYEDQALKLQDAGYTVESESCEGHNPKIPDAIWRIDAVKGEKETLEYVRVLYFTSEDSAIDYYTGMFAQSLEDLRQESPEMMDDFASERVNNIVLYGTVDAVEEALA